MPYAIVKTGGKQYRVEEGQTLLVERLADEEGATVALQPLLYAADEAVFDADALAGTQARAALAHDDLAAADRLPGERLDAEALRVGVAPVARRAEALLVCHLRGLLRGAPGPAL